MRHLQRAATRVALAGLAATGLGVGMVIVGIASGPGAPAFADSTPYELYCPGTPVGDIALNDVTTSGSITPATVSAGTQFNVTGYQTTVSLPASLGSAAQSVSPTLSGSATGTIDVTGGAPASMGTGTLNFSVTLPSPVTSPVALAVPTTPVSIGPFTASGSQVTAQNNSSTTLTLIVSGSPLALTCTSYPNDTTSTSGILPPGTPAPTVPPVAPVIATSGGGTTTTAGTGSTTSTTGTGSTTTTTTAPSGALTGPYELYCPKAPVVGDIALNC